MRFIGNKTPLLDEIEKVINENVKEANTFLDIFSGSTSVARHFKDKYTIYSNDLLYFSYVLQKGTIENNKLPTFDMLNFNLDISDPIKYFNDMDTAEMESLDQEKRFFQNNYAPTGDRMYLTDSNALRVDFIRYYIEEWKNKEYIDSLEYYYLLTVLIETIPYFSNIAGTYGAFNKFWDRRSLKKLELIVIDVLDNGKENKCYNEDGLELIKKISGDIVYIDPPYNSRQYSPNYHVLETAAKFDFPEVKGITGQRDYSHKISNFCSKVNAEDELEELIKGVNFKHIVMSYSSDGIIPIEKIEAIFKKYGKEETYKLYKIPYRRFKSRTLKNKTELIEYLIYIEK